METFVDFLRDLANGKIAEIASTQIPVSRQETEQRAKRIRFLLRVRAQFIRDHLQAWLSKHNMTLGTVSRPFFYPEFQFKLAPLVIPQKICPIKNRTHGLACNGNIMMQGTVMNQKAMVAALAQLLVAVEQNQPHFTDAKARGETAFCFGLVLHENGYACSFMLANPTTELYKDGDEDADHDVIDFSVVAAPEKKKKKRNANSDQPSTTDRAAKKQRTD
jgi:hypothetical protein